MRTSVEICGGNVSVGGVVWARYAEPITLVLSNARIVRRSLNPNGDEREIEFVTEDGTELWIHRWRHYFKTKLGTPQLWEWRAGIELRPPKSS